MTETEAGWCATATRRTINLLRECHLRRRSGGAGKRHYLLRNRCAHRSATNRRSAADVQVACAQPCGEDLIDLMRHTEQRQSHGQPDLPYARYNIY